MTKHESGHIAKTITEAIRRVQHGNSPDALVTRVERILAIDLADYYDDLPGNQQSWLSRTLGIYGECQCTSCGCAERATCTDEAGTEVCADCVDYALDDDGQVVCAKDERVEIVTESCGAGYQTRSFARLKPPPEPEVDMDGEYCCYWSTCGDDEHVVERYHTYDAAAQAVAAKDWPGPTDHAQNYLCGYEVRRLLDGRWIPCVAEAFKEEEQ